VNEFLQRRRLLFYLGLGGMGTGVATALKLTSTSQADHSVSSKIMPAPSPANSEGAISEIATSAPGGKSLPEFQGISQWLNSTPLAIADLKDKVVLVQFWTFACINCQRTLPYITQWHRQYADQGLQIIGIHTPEFAFERDIGNIKRAIQQHQITYPVPIDNEFKTWQAYDNQYWPHLFLADRQGLLRYDHIGEGAYDQTEQTIRQLIG
jgi:thiol-disulfide isomerase/thioredoxin